jgi:prepilin-type N-terminal cleavage/methylation domain-containing protein
MAGQGNEIVRQRGFTLVEIMVAVGIMAVIMTIAIPTLFQNMHPDSMRKAVKDVMTICSDARARAILDGATMEVRIRPGDRTFSVGPAADSGGNEIGASRSFMFQGDEMVEQPAAGPGGGLPGRKDYKWGDRMDRRPAGGGGPVSGAVTLSPTIIIEGLGVNGEDWTEDEEARIRFRPNGTCDEMSIVLMSDKGERRNIWLEVVTGLAELEVDPTKFRDR